MSNTGFATRLVNSRTKIGMSQASLAEAAEIAATQLSRYETGKVIPKFEVMLRLSLALGVSFSWLAHGEGDINAAVPLVKEKGMEQLSETQYRFYTMLKPYPAIAKLWNWTTRELNVDAYQRSLCAMSSGEAVLARFFYSIWDGNNQAFDITEAAAKLDRTERELIANWLTHPFWP
ncbi:helix-turn-helix domain-containing protein [Pectobacterium versatile]|uniref:helix-turn-helix domain-containing protein n=1 Tax=Pectobacterium versatile TaxID=2488639 RepID=UPI001F1D2ACC|nr:helix-turn-helix transcriptional regulator [Pectobacterium versatile]